MREAVSRSDRRDARPYQQRWALLGVAGALVLLTLDGARRLLREVGDGGPLTDGWQEFVGYVTFGAMPAAAIGLLLGLVLEPIVSKLPSTSELRRHLRLLLPVSATTLLIAFGALWVVRRDPVVAAALGICLPFLSSVPLVARAATSK